MFVSVIKGNCFDQLQVSNDLVIDRQRNDLSMSEYTRKTLTKCKKSQSYRYKSKVWLRVGPDPSRKDLYKDAVYIIPSAIL